LNGERNFVSPLGWITNEASEDTTTDDLSNNPTKVNIAGTSATASEVDLRGQERSESDWHEFGSVGDGHCLESAEWETEEDDGGEEHGEAGSEDWEMVSMHQGHEIIDLHWRKRKQMMATRARSMVYR
jgi:hypothetical protein